MAFAQLKDIKLYYNIQGEGEPLVLVSGFTADHHGWDLVVEQFAQYYQVIRIDNRGAGQSDCPDGPYTIRQMAQDIADLCEHLNISKAVFVGNSMGGKIVQTLSAIHPNLVRAVVVCNTGVRINACFSLFAKGMKLLRDQGADEESLIRARLPVVFSAPFLTQTESKFEEIVALAKAAPHPATEKGFVAQLAALDASDNTEDLKQIKAPLLLISADRDIICLEKDMRSMLDIVPHAQYYVFKDVGHVPHIEVPNDFVKVVHEFIEKQGN